MYYANIICFLQCQSIIIVRSLTFTFKITHMIDCDMLSA